MIVFFRDGTKIKCIVDSRVKEVGAHFPNFVFEAGNELYAEILSRHLRKTLRDTMKTIREQSYNQGYKDAKSKKRKSTYHDLGFYIK